MKQTNDAKSDKKVKLKILGPDDPLPEANRTNQFAKTPLLPPKKLIKSRVKSSQIKKLDRPSGHDEQLVSPLRSYNRSINPQKVNGW